MNRERGEKEGEGRVKNEAGTSQTRPPRHRLCPALRRIACALCARWLMTQLCGWSLHEDGSQGWNQTQTRMAHSCLRPWRAGRLLLTHAKHPMGTCDPTGRNPLSPPGQHRVESHTHRKPRRARGIAFPRRSQHPGTLQSRVVSGVLFGGSRTGTTGA